jgi:hypothetical protein
VEKITYRKWNECYRISNDSVSIIINASAGGRIMVFEKRGINLIYEDPSQDGLLLEDFLGKGFDPDGGRFDYGQERITQHIHATTYMGPWTASIINDNSLQITSVADQNLGILSSRIFTLEPNSCHLRITQTMKNISDQPREYFFWGRTLVKLGGKLFMPLNPQSKIPGKWGRYIWGDQEVFANDPDDQGVKIDGEIFSLIPEKAGNAKYGCDSKDGWMAYGYKSLLFLMKYEYKVGAEYKEFYGQTNIFYTNKSSFAEMEPISPSALLQPGENFSYSQDWYLLDYTPCIDTEFNVNEAFRFMFVQMK